MKLRSQRWGLGPRRFSLACRIIFDWRKLLSTLEDGQAYSLSRAKIYVVYSLLSTDNSSTAMVTSRLEYWQILKKVASLNHRIYNKGCFAETRVRGQLGAAG